MRASELHRRYRSGGLPILKGMIYRFGFELSLRLVLQREYGGRQLRSARSQIFYLGGETHDWESLAAQCDNARRFVAQRIAADFGVGVRLSRNLTIALVAEDPGLPAVGRRLELHNRYEIPDTCRLMYFWFERALFLAGPIGTAQWQSDLHYGLCPARLHEVLGATWSLGWAATGYAALVAHEGLGGQFDRTPAVLGHVADARSRGAAIGLAELVECDVPPEEHFGPRAYHETSLLFVQFLRSQFAARPSVRRFVHDELRAPHWPKGYQPLRALEAAFGMSVNEVEAEFIGWCEGESRARRPD